MLVSVYPFGGTLENLHYQWKNVSTCYQDPVKVGYSCELDNICKKKTSLSTIMLCNLGINAPHVTLSWIHVLSYLPSYERTIMGQVLRMVISEKSTNLTKVRYEQVD